MAARKKSVRKKVAAGKKETARKAASPRKTTRRKSAAKAKSKSSKAAPRKKVAARPKGTRSGAAARRKAAALGRPRVAGTAELELMFQKDLEAREVFAFLGVKTLKDLEAHSPDEILERLTAPMVRTVGRIRKALAMNNRCLAGDQKFAVAFKKQLT